MDKPIIEVRNISKKYNISHQRGGYVALRDILMNVLRSPFSFLKSKVKQVTGLETKEEFWALKDVSFKIQKGEVVGVIGANGAGKSTLLKILSRITPPTEGEIILRGRVGSLLEVGTGFHPELTGRENIFLNGAILGMKKREIANKFNEIVTFAGIEKFLDTPVKHYSSGMYVRLAFSVAAHMDPDILIIDEVLAVGDAEFQKKCLGKMEEITRSDGRTILFVSHNMSAIQELCTSCILLRNGKVEAVGKTKDIIDNYINSGIQNRDVNAKKEILTDNGEIKIIDSWVENSKGQKTSIVSAGEDIKLIAQYRSNIKNEPVKFAFAVTNTLTGEQLTDLVSDNMTAIPSEGRIVCTLPGLPLNTGTYSFNIAIRVNGFISSWIKEVAIFEVVFGDFFGTGKLPDQNQGSFLIKQTWEINQ